MVYASTALALSPTRPYAVIPGGRPAFSNSLFDSFLDYTDRKDTTIKGYITCIRQFIKWLALNGITQPEREHIKAYRDYLHASDLAAGTKAQYLRAVKHFFKWTASEGLYPDVSKNIHGAQIKNDCHKKDALPRDRVEAIAGAIDRNDEAGKRLYAMYLLCVKCGLRTIEVHRADVGDIKTIDNDTFLYVQPKGHDEKDSPKYLFPEVKAAIDDYLAARSTKATPKGPLFTSTSNRSKGGRIATTTISTMLKELLVNAGFDSNRLTAHSLRATAATAAFEAGLTLFEVQQLMGHCDPRTTEIYIKDQNQLQIEKKGRVAIDKYLKGELSNGILPELETELMTLTHDEQKELLEQIRARKGGRA